MQAWDLVLNNFLKEETFPGPSLAHISLPGIIRTERCRQEGWWALQWCLSQQFNSYIYITSRCQMALEGWKDLLQWNICSTECSGSALECSFPDAVESLWDLGIGYKINWISFLQKEMLGCQPHQGLPQRWGRPHSFWSLYTRQLLNETNAKSVAS